MCLCYSEPVTVSDPNAAGIDQLAAAAAQGDRTSLDDLLGHVHTGTLADPAIRRLIFDEDRVEEVRQEVLIAVARSISGFRGEAKFTTWLYALARTVALMHLRRSRPETPVDDLPTESERISSIVATHAIVRDAVAALPDKYRTVVQLRDIEGHSYEEIAQRLDLKLNTVRSHLSRGRALLAASIELESLDG